ncbi:hypothetical protein TNCV_2891031 [Trichonephila clavipes]|nr:hypothetical protein TNCV_2891031 [Trichonephila clavipes]
MYSRSQQSIVMRGDYFEGHADITLFANKKRITVLLSSLVQIDYGAAMLNGLLHSNGYEDRRVTRCIEIVRVHYFVRGGFVGHRSRASSKASLFLSSGRRAIFLGGSNRGCVAPADARVGVGSTKKAD